LCAVFIEHIDEVVAMSCSKRNDDRNAACFWPLVRYVFNCTCS